MKVCFTFKDDDENYLTLHLSEIENEHPIGSTLKRSDYPHDAPFKIIRLFSVRSSQLLFEMRKVAFGAFNSPLYKHRRANRTDQIELRRVEGGGSFWLPEIGLLCI